jgi:hypothetical protein
VNAARSDPPTPRARAHARDAVAGVGASGVKEGAEDPAMGAPGTEGRGILAARAAGTLPSGDLGVLVVRRGRGGRERRWAGPLRGGSLRPLTESRGGSRGASAWGGRHQAVYGRGGARYGGVGARRGGVWECCSGAAGRRHGVRRALEEEKAGILHLEVNNRFSWCSDFEGLEFKLLSPC